MAGHTAADQDILPEAEDHPEEVAADHIDQAAGHHTGPVPEEADHTVRLEVARRTDLGLEEVGRIVPVEEHRIDPEVVHHTGLEEAADHNLAGEEHRTGHQVEHRNHRVRGG